MDMFVKMVNSANTFLWNVILILLLCGTGVYYTFRLKFVQIREFTQGLKQVFGGIGKKNEKKERCESHWLLKVKNIPRKCFWICTKQC